MNTITNTINHFLNRINHDFDLGSDGLVYFDPNPEEDRWVHEITDGNVSCFYLSEFEALAAVQRASTALPCDENISQVWGGLDSYAVSDLKVRSLTTERKEIYYTVVCKDALLEITEHDPEDFWDYRQVFGSMDDQIVIDGHFDSFDAEEDHPEIADEIREYREKTLRDAEKIIRTAGLALHILNSDRDPEDKFKAALELFAHAYEIEMEYGDAPWTREAYDLLTEAEERMR